MLGASDPSMVPWYKSKFLLWSLVSAVLAALLHDCGQMSVTSLRQLYVSVDSNTVFPKTFSMLKSEVQIIMQNLVRICFYPQENLSVDTDMTCSAANTLLLWVSRLKYASSSGTMLLPRGISLLWKKVIMMLSVKPANSHLRCRWVNLPKIALINIVRVLREDRFRLLKSNNLWEIHYSRRRYRCGGLMMLLKLLELRSHCLTHTKHLQGNFCLMQRLFQSEPRKWRS